ncbi:hypothetical protein [Actinomadura sp. CNU-125]|uniref:hypothetical protein n=1 Tax=Actinomadura sp. CNU-125 TaxID=1904961 RepID=UPI0013014311|nr:hypothetical protein [Actinomadura sp. CNU-125]
MVGTTRPTSHRPVWVTASATLRNLALDVLAVNDITKITETVQRIGRDHNRAIPLLTLT